MFYYTLRGFCTSYFAAPRLVSMSLCAPLLSLADVYLFLSQTILSFISVHAISVQLTFMSTVTIPVLMVTINHRNYLVICKQMLRNRGNQLTPQMLAFNNRITTLYLSQFSHFSILHRFCSMYKLYYLHITSTYFPT